MAVLPFENISGDKTQDYFCDGVTEDIITELSRFSELFVIARNSSFQYKGKTIDVRQVGRDLGVRYILQGSIRREGRRVRISVQLADAVTGAHRWAERYDRQVEDVFAVQDEVARTIVAILVAHVNKAEIERSLNKPPETWQAYDYYLRGADAFASYHSSLKANVLYEARRLLEQSIAIDPNYARAYARLARTQISAYLNALDKDYLNPAALERSYQLARKAIQLDHSLLEAHSALGHALSRRREHEAAVAEFEKAMALNPNFTDWRFGEVLVLAGDPARAIEAVKGHMQSDPFYGPFAPALLGLAHYMLKQYAQAVPLLRECASRAPDFRSGHVWLAATYAQLGKPEEARAEAAEVLRIEPNWTIEGTQARHTPFKRTEDAEHLFDGLRKAGLPER
jgi:adenylate cyclase